MFNTPAAVSKLRQPLSNLLLHMDGADGSKDFPDSGLGGVDNPHIMTARGVAEVDTSLAQFGTGSLFISSTADGNALDTPSNTDFHFGAGDFTIEYWVRFSNYGAIPVYNLTGLRADAGELSWQQYYTIADNEFTFAWSVNGSSFTNSKFAFTAGGVVFFHVASVRRGNEFKLFVNGQQAGGTIAMVGTLWPTDGGFLTVGGVSPGNGSLNGRIDEYRIVKGKSVWWDDFTPPDAPYIG